MSAIRLHIFSMVSCLDLFWMHIAITFSLPPLWRSQKSVSRTWAPCVTVAETKEEAEYEAKPQDIWRLLFIRGRLAPLMTPEEARDYPLSEMDRMMIQENRKIHLVGDAKEIATLLQQEQEQYGFDEAMIVSIPHSQKKRLEVYRLLARELL